MQGSFKTVQQFTECFLKKQRFCLTVFNITKLKSFSISKDRMNTEFLLSVSLKKFFRDKDGENNYRIPLFMK